MYSSPFAKQNRAEIGQKFQTMLMLKLLLWTKGVERVKVLNALGPLCLWQCLFVNFGPRGCWKRWWGPPKRGFEVENWCWSAGNTTTGSSHCSDVLQVLSRAHICLPTNWLTGPPQATLFWQCSFRQLLGSWTTEGFESPFKISVQIVKYQSYYSEDSCCFETPIKISVQIFK